MRREEELKAIARAEYREAALQANSGRTACCGTGRILDMGKLYPTISTLYDAEQKESRIKTLSLPSPFA